MLTELLQKQIDHHTKKKTM